MRETVRELRPYRPPEAASGLALHRNTNRRGPHPATRDPARLLEGIDLSEYPDGTASPVRQALAERHGMDPTGFLTGNGSNEMFDLIFKALLEPGEAVVYPGPSYSLYRHYALANGARACEIPLGEDFQLRPNAFLETEAAMIVLCTPNNPTGNALDPEAILPIVESNPDRPVVIDEAYAEFGEHNWLERSQQFPNLLVVRTLSKAYGLAGARVGYLAGPPNLVDVIDRVRLPYNLGALSQAVAVAALRAPGFVEEYVRMIVEERPRWHDMLVERGFRVWPSQANFLLAQVPPVGERDALVAELWQAGVLVRIPGDHPRLQDSVRVTVGTPEDREALAEALDEVLPCR